jgi:cytochrome c5
MTTKWSSRAQASGQERSPFRANVLVVLIPFAFAAVPACGQETGPSGEDVVDVVCAECHATGEKGAPKIGDRAAWAKRATQGLSTLTQHALDGIRNMPAHGGDSSLSDLMVQRAIVYMVNRSGGRWIEPPSDSKLPGERSGAQIAQMHCAVCHEKGYGGAPRIGNRAAWNPRLKFGIDRLVKSAERGQGDMPARGGMFPCSGIARVSDEEIRSAIIYMASQKRTLPAETIRKASSR